MLNATVIAQYADEAAFLWTQRARATGSPRHTLRTLAALDERLDAQLDGLRLAGDAGLGACRRALENVGGGEVFTLSVLAFGAGDRQHMLDALAAGCASPAARRGLISALGWLHHDEVAPWIGRLVQAAAPLHRTIGIAAAAARREDPGERLTAAVGDADPVLRARALRAAGELKRHDLHGRLAEQLKDADDGCRFWAAWSLTLLGDFNGLRSLVSWLERDDHFGAVARQLAMRAVSLEHGREGVRGLLKDAARRRSAVGAIGVLGDPASIPWLIGVMDSADLARLAGEAFSAITGIDLDEHELNRQAPLPGPAASADTASDDDPPVDDPDDGLPWPDRVRVEAWWRERSASYQMGVRHLAGQPISAPAIRQLITAGTQAQRAAAALELALLDESAILFEVRGRGSAQRRQLARAAAA